MRLVSYARQSKSDRDRVPSTEWQSDEIGRWAGARGDEILSSFADVDTSGYRKVARPGFEAMLEALASPAVDGAVVWRLDRLSRQGQWGEDVIRFMEAKGPKVLLSVLEDIDTSTAAGELVLGVRLSLVPDPSRQPIELGPQHRDVGQLYAFGDDGRVAGEHPLDRVGLPPEHPAQLHERASLVAGRLGPLDLPPRRRRNTTRALLQTERQTTGADLLRDVLPPGLHGVTLAEIPSDSERT